MTGRIHTFALQSIEDREDPVPRWPAWSGAEELAACLAFDIVEQGDVRAFGGVMFAERELESRTWRPARRAARFDELLAEHLLAGSLGGAPFGGVRALAVRYDPDDRVGLFNLDIDGNGETPTVEILRRLAETFGAGTLMPISGSGADGRVRVLGRLVEPLSVRVLVRLMHRVLLGLGLDAEVEVFPNTRPGRLPFGAGGCRRYTLGMESLGLFAPPVLAREFLALPAIDLAKVARRFPRPKNEPKSPSKRAKKGAAFVPPSDPEIERLLREGARRGERDAAGYRMICEGLRRRYTEHETLTFVAEWMRSGGISRTDGGKSTRLVEQEIARLPRRIAKVYATHPRASRVRPAPLTADEILRAAERIRGAAKGRRRFDEDAAGTMVMWALSLMKGHRIAGLSSVRLGHEEWREHGGKSYVRLRELSGLFTVTDDYLSPFRCERLGISTRNAKDRAYWTNFEFDDAPVPRRNIASTWGAAVREARAIVARREKRAAREAAKRPLVPEVPNAPTTPEAPPVEHRRTLPSALKPRVAARVAKWFRSSSEPHEQPVETTKREPRDDEGLGGRGGRDVLRGLRMAGALGDAPVVRPCEGPGLGAGERASPRGDRGRGVHGRGVACSSTAERNALQTREVPRVEGGAGAERAAPVSDGDRARDLLPDAAGGTQQDEGASPSSSIRRSI